MYWICGFSYCGVCVRVCTRVRKRLHVVIKASILIQTSSCLKIVLHVVSVFSLPYSHNLFRTSATMLIDCMAAW